jgi:hypothetical protein
MRMACLGSHFLIFICEDTKEDHERCIAFLWNPKGLFVQTKDNSCQDDSGRQPFSKLKLDLLKPLKKN